MKGHNFSFVLLSDTRQMSSGFLLIRNMKHNLTISQSRPDTLQSNPKILFSDQRNIVIVAMSPVALLCDMLVL
jgi:hypothetical protein